jgi:hypothetical protein
MFLLERIRLLGETHRHNRTTKSKSEFYVFQPNVPTVAHQAHFVILLSRSLALSLSRALALSLSRSLALSLSRSLALSLSRSLALSQQQQCMALGINGYGIVVH